MELNQGNQKKMGLSSSQARLLHLTGRMHQIEYKAAKLEAQKLQMANESRRVYEDYENALDATKIQMATLNTDGTINYIDANYFNMKEAGYDLRFEGKVVVDDATAANYIAAADNKDYFVALQTGRVTTENNQEVDGAVEIYTADQLMSMEEGKNYRLMSDIDLTGKDWTSKVLSTGCTFDGNGHTIKGLKTALFSDVSGTVTNLNVSGNVTSNAILANNAHSDANFNNITVSGSVNSTDNNVGALIGYADGANLKVDKCSANASVVSKYNCVGTLLGYINSTSAQISNCSVSGSVQGGYKIGGLVGNVNGATITNCSANSSVVATDIANYRDSWAGGFASMISSCTISNCESRGNVKGAGHVLGGFVGLSSNSTISNSNAYGNILADENNINNEYDSYSGGFVGGLNNHSIINNCNAYGKVTTPYSGRCAGFVWGDISNTPSLPEVNNCYSNSDDPFAHDSSVKVTKSSAPNNNVITVTPPTIKRTTETAGGDDSNSKLFDDIKQNGYILESEIEEFTKNNGKNTKCFTNMVNEGYLFIYEKDKTTGDYIQTSVSTNTKLQEVSDETELRKAEAKYEADMKRIDNKDKKFDTDLAALDNERNAIKEEMETLKTVAKDNVERTFKLFS